MALRSGGSQSCPSQRKNNGKNRFPQAPGKNGRFLSISLNFKSFLYQDQGRALGSQWTVQVMGTGIG